MPGSASNDNERAKRAPAFAPKALRRVRRSFGGGGSHANGARRRSGARESVQGSPRGEAPRLDMMRVGLAIVLVAALAAALGPSLTPYSPSAQVIAQRLEPPSRSHPLGLDELGRDILA